MSRIVVSLLALALLLGAGTFVAPMVAADAAPAPSSPERVVAETAGAAAQAEGEDEAGSSLPEGLGRIFASLGLYVVTMFTMAIGTEILVDVVKLGVGLKSKPTARQTLEEYERVLPGSLASLGLGAKARHNLEHQIAAMKELLEPAFKVEQAFVNLREESFRRTLADLLGADASEQEIAKAGKIVKNQVRAAVSRVNDSLNLSDAVTNPLRQRLDSFIDDVLDKSTNLTAEDVIRQISVFVNGELAEPVTAWTEAQINALRSVSYETARKVYDTQVGPQLENAGLSPETKARIKLQFENFLENYRTSTEAEVYLDSFNNLLQEVEKQRDELRNRVVKWLDSRKRAGRTTSPITASGVDDPRAAASTLLAIQRRDKQEESTRVQYLRLISVIVGVVLAYLLQIDSAVLLSGLLPAGARFLTTQLIPERISLGIANNFQVQVLPLTAGIILTGLAASAGSGFWHDQLSRLQTVQKRTEAAYTAVESLVVSKEREGE